MKKLTILGSTGSIGVQALSVAENLGWQISSIAAGGKNIELLENQARRFKPEFVAVYSESAAKDLKTRLADTDISVGGGKEAIIKACSYPCDILLNAIVGIAGLLPTMAAIDAGHNIALANKETLVTGGEIVMRHAKDKNVKILPVDSEHSAIFQSLECSDDKTCKKIILTASGGPFFGKKRTELENITPKQALKHPNWSMGPKITIDSATLMNKGLEVIEAVHLFNVPADNIEVVVHKQSILHSAVEFEDGAVIGQLGTPDMAIPIQYALTYPKRVRSTAKPLSLCDIGSLTFERPDIETFTCLGTCINAIKAKGLAPAMANGANEKAVELFLKGRITFLQIGELVQKVTDMAPKNSALNIESILEADKYARECVEGCIL